METTLEDGACLDGSEAHRPLITAIFNRHQAITKLLIESRSREELMSTQPVKSLHPTEPITGCTL